MTGSIFQPLDIVTYDTEALHSTADEDEYFGLVFVEEGSGYRMLGDEQIPFLTGDLFMQTSGSHNAITLEKHSRLHFIKFRQLLIEAGTSHNVLSFSHEQFRKLEFILYSEQQHKQSLIHLKSDKVSVFALFNVLIAEASHRPSYADSNIALCLLALLNMVARNILESNYVQAVHPQAITHDVLHYINYHIYEPGKVTPEHLALEFNIPSAGFHAYFLQQYGQELESYIIAYKMRLADIRLAYTRMTMTEIATELQFADADQFVQAYLALRGHLPQRPS